MNTENKAEQLIILLTRETYDGNVEWNNQPVPSGLTEGSSCQVSPRCTMNF